MSQRYMIPPYVPAMESYCILFEAFSAKECQDIREMAALLEFQKGTVGSGTQDDKVRDSDLTWINDDPNLPGLDVRRFAIDRTIHTLSRVNGEKFDMDLDFFDALQYTKYALNQHYDWHVDVHEGERVAAHRKLSMSVMLTGPDEYEGGDLQLVLGGNPDRALVLRPPLGAAVIFYSHIPHRVTPVTKGDRASMVTWACGPRIR